MRYLFGTPGSKALQEFCDERVLLAFDFDGTLSPIVTRPEKAALPEKTRELLEQVSQQYRVAVISGRKAADLKGRLGFQPDYLIGNHGVEGLPSWRKQMHRVQKVCERWRKQIEAGADEIPLQSGVFLENKVYTLALHYRKSSRKHLVRRRLLEIVRSLNPVPRVVPGKSVLNLVPEGIPHKGNALLELMRMSGAKKAIYIGDDDTDEDVFGLGHPGILCIRVGLKRTSAAPYYLKRQSELNRVLQRFLSPS